RIPSTCPATHSRRPAPEWSPPRRSATTSTPGAADGRATSHATRWPRVRDADRRPRTQTSTHALGDNSACPAMLGVPAPPGPRTRPAGPVYHSMAQPQQLPLLEPPIMTATVHKPDPHGRPLVGTRPLWKAP